MGLDYPVHDPTTLRNVFCGLINMTSTLIATCLCGINAEKLQLDSQIPFSVSSCACNSCRYSSGVLYTSRIPIRQRPTAVEKLQRYDSSNKLSRYFCPVCGSHMFVHAVKDDSWSVCSGAVDHVVGLEHVSVLSLEHIMQHDFVGDTRDGGLAVCLSHFDDNTAPLFAQAPNGTTFEKSPTNDAIALEPSHPRKARLDADSIEENATAIDKISGRCHCGGVNFRITRPGVVSTHCSSPFPDLLVPYHSSSSANPQDIKWWLRANGSKYLAGTCACRSCRLGSGYPIQSWAFIPKANILQADGERLRYEMGTLQQVESSKDCFREFCRICGATVFWHCRERPDLVDVSVGLLRADEGSRAESWLHWWTDRVSFKEDALDQVLVSALELGLENIEVEE
ncbi:Mss4-like protein [Exophiala viscosa]|uniref:Mss4-like protein n=1 Tax=Exophiala viscosa TaxID=2486360 RepID=A0AAN6IIU6_9EURO|nr:Mss4-like protein [Exophiala viscosa]